MKLKTIYVCQKCEYESSHWQGKCPMCGSWNSFVEDTINIGKTEKSGLSGTPRNVRAKEPSLFGNAKKENQIRIPTNIKEFDRVLGGGFFPGSLTLLGGEPGIGKSTLTLQVANNLAKTHKVLMISGEESLEQIAERAFRLGVKENEQNISVVNEFTLETILETIRKAKSDFVIIDSIQVISSADMAAAAGSISQVRYCTEKIMEMAKTTETPVILISHVTKDGNLAGPKVLEHLVDTVLLLEGDRFQQFRLLKTSKNRFGNSSEVGIFEMNEKGLNEVENPSKQFLEGRKESAYGSAITAAVEGTRAFLVEVQALTSTTTFGYPKRTANGFDLNRLQILIAVLEKYGRLNLQNQDIFINIVGGIRLSEPAADLAVLMAIASSYIKKPLPKDSVIFGEVGLSGELRKVSFAEKRAKEAEKIGLNKVISSTQFKEIPEVLKTI